MENQISELLKISMNNIRDLVDVNIIIGNEIRTDNALIIPVSKVKCGFVSGGIEQKKQKNDEFKTPFGGGSGANLTITPVAFLVCQQEDVKVLHLEENTHIYEKITDALVTLLKKAKNKDPKIFEVIKE